MVHAFCNMHNSSNTCVYVVSAELATWSCPEWSGQLLIRSGLLKYYCILTLAEVAIGSVLARKTRLRIEVWNAMCVNSDPIPLSVTEQRANSRPGWSPHFGIAHDAQQPRMPSTDLLPENKYKVSKRYIRALSSSPFSPLPRPHPFR